MRETAAIFDMDVERDRKECIRLAQKSVGADRELAEFLLNHPQYTSIEIAGWTGDSERRIQRLRAWARGGYAGLPSDASNAARNRRTKATSTSSPPLKSKDNSIPTEEEAEESYQETLFEQACLFLEEMTDETRQRLFAKLKGDYGYVS
jgi:hypothetical protein